MRQPNALINESSPYLLQHAYNPVRWMPWGEEALQRARDEDKPILLSIGYSSCHWCHVMERESFEDETVAAFMNQHFICIKVDREERPDIDHIYMNAVQALTGHGGWPLHAFLTPEAKPFYGGTYFPPRPLHGRPSWMQALQAVVHAFHHHREAVEQQAQKLTNYISQMETAFIDKKNDVINIEPHGNDAYATSLEQHIRAIKTLFDDQHGGFGRAPKFPHFLNLLFLLQYSACANHKEALRHVLFSLNKMLQGGIYDHIGGGIARYSTDDEWRVPHFEKMLYDNALLIRVLAEAYAFTGNMDYKETLLNTVIFILREMTSPEGGFYTALDADSEGEEGRFYVWTKLEIDSLLGTDADWFCSLYHISEQGNWEGKNILYRDTSLLEYASQIHIDPETLKQKHRQCLEKLLQARNRRTRPALDHKIILGWNALTCIALATAYQYLQDSLLYHAALKNIDFLSDTFIQCNQDQSITELYHVYIDGKATQPAFLDDAALLAEALISCYQISFRDRYLHLAHQLCDFIIRHFYHTNAGWFYYTCNKQKDLVFRPAEFTDGVFPSGNSTMAHLLYELSIIFDHSTYRNLCDHLLHRVQKSIGQYPLSFGNWALLLLRYVFPTRQVVIIGDKSEQFAQQIMPCYEPLRILISSPCSCESIPLLSGKKNDHITRIYLCENNTCYAPLESVEKYMATTTCRQTPNIKTLF